MGTSVKDSRNSLIEICYMLYGLCSYYTAMSLLCRCIDYFLQLHLIFRPKLIHLSCDAAIQLHHNSCAGLCSAATQCNANAVNMVKYERTLPMFTRVCIEGVFCYNVVQIWAYKPPILIVLVWQ